MAIALPRHETNRLITPVTSALSRGERVEYKERDLRLLGRIINKIAPGTFPEVVRTATIGDKRRQHKVRPYRGDRQNTIPSAEGIRFSYSDIAIPKTADKPAVAEHPSPIAEGGYTLEEHLEAARLYAAEGNLEAVQAYVDAGYFTLNQVGLDLGSTPSNKDSA